VISSSQNFLFALSFLSPTSPPFSLTVPFGSATVMVSCFLPFTFPLKALKGASVSLLCLFCLLLIHSACVSRSHSALEKQPFKWFDVL
jgi:hypothetical protein